MNELDAKEAEGSKLHDGFWRNAKGINLVSPLYITECPLKEGKVPVDKKNANVACTCLQRGR